MTESSRVLSSAAAGAAVRAAARHQRPLRPLPMAETGVWVWLWGWGPCGCALRDLYADRTVKVKNPVPFPLRTLAVTLTAVWERDTRNARRVKTVISKISS